jgi:UDP-N-acetylmuramate: L-alanyl-gamma-D-glutamyl-meso-diaminopimelate ligase
MRIHVVGVAGTGMGALAGLLVELGHDVSGSDVAFDPPIGPELAAWGVRCLTGYDPAHLVPAPDLVVVGNVCRPDNVEARAAIDGGLPVTHIAGALARFALAGTEPLVVAGTHGKTTTSALSAWLLDRAGGKPGFLIGGIPLDFDRGFRAPPPKSLDVLGERSQRRSRPFVVEGDEYDTAFFEKTPKFLHYGARVAIITSIEHDHIDIYPNPEDYVSAFERFVEGVPADGLIVANAADAEVRRVVHERGRSEVAWYALAGNDTGDVVPEWLAAPAGSGPTGTRFDLFAGGVAAGRLAITLSGEHNVSNAVAALAAAAQGYGFPIAALRTPLAQFRGVRRRQELIGTPGGVFVYDDFAHHPSAVRVTLAGLAARHAGSAVVAVFEPRSATACRNLHQEQYAESFSAARHVVLAPLGRSNVPPAERLDPEKLARDLQGRGIDATSAGSIDAIVTRVVELSRPGDVVAVLSNGAFGGIHSRLLEALAGQSAEGGDRTGAGAAQARRQSS